MTLAIGSGLALFLYLHTLTEALAASNRFIIQRNAIFLLIYTVMLGLLAVLGYLAIAARIQPRPHYGFNSAMPALFDTVFPPWFADIALAAIAIGALVPAAMMALAAGNLFTRNLYRELIRPGAGPTEQTRVARSVSLLVKCGASASSSPSPRPS